MDKKFNFFEFFNPVNGSLLRSNAFIDGIESLHPATMRSFPELIDIGIMGNCHVSTLKLCTSFGVDCYQCANTLKKSNLPLDKYQEIIQQSKNRVFQIVLGGAGDPIKHENFAEILQLTREAKIVPNLTTTGYLINDNEIEAMSKYCGAVAVSFYSRLRSTLEEGNNISINAIRQLIEAKCKVNIHFVLSRETIKDAIVRLQKNLFPKGINGIIFLLYKAIGEGKQSKVLDPFDKNYEKLLNIIQNNEFDFRIGFDTCQTPLLRSLCPKISQSSIEPCESARFSMYIDSDFKAYPCSFACHDKEFNLDLNKLSILEVWNSSTFNNFRQKQDNLCPTCEESHCYGCALDNGLNFCKNRF